jgi:hypothetical protein
MRGHRLSAVTLANGTALTTNYLSVELQRAREPGLLIEVTVGAATERGVAEASPAPVA